MFIKDLAAELNKSASTISSFLRKHLPTTLSKRKNANNRLALFVDGDGIAGARNRYSPTIAPDIIPTELIRLQDENASLRARVAELEAENASLLKPAEVRMSEVQFAFDNGKQQKPLENMTLNELISEHDRIFAQMALLTGSPSTRIKYKGERALHKQRKEQIRREFEAIDGKVVPFERKALAAQNKRNQAPTLADVGQATEDHVTMSFFDRIEALEALVDRDAEERERQTRTRMRETIRSKHACTLPEDELETLVDLELKRRALDVELKIEDEIETEATRIKLKRQFES